MVDEEPEKQTKRRLKSFRERRNILISFKTRINGVKKHSELKYAILLLSKHGKFSQSCMSKVLPLNSPRANIVLSVQCRVVS